VEEKCLKTLSEYRKRRCRCHVWWKYVPEAGAGNWKSLFSDGGDVEWQYSKLAGGSWPESLPGWHVSDTSEVRRQVHWYTAVKISEFFTRLPRNASTCN